jgi:hypothetical protein
MKSFAWSALCVVLALAAPAGAADLGQLDGFDVQWDTTVRETMGFRTDGANASLLANINGDDGDRAFAPGLISARTDLFTEVTAARGDLGFDVSAQGWYDPVYQQSNANRSPATFNPAGVPNTQFPADVRTLMGENAELLNAYAKDRFAIGDVPVSLRLGRQTLLWGESLFFANNGIAAGQAPVDEIKALSAPLAEARELYLPVAQAVLRVELQPGLALEAYDQFEWRRDRLPGVTSYFSTTDILDVGGDRLLLPDGAALWRGADTVPHGIGQFGVALRGSGGDADFGLYALRYDSKAPEPVFDGAAGQYHLVFPSGIDVLGASASSYLGDSNVAAEISVRQHMPLVTGMSGLSGGGGGGGGYASVYSAIRMATNASALLPPFPQPAVGARYDPGQAGGYATGTTGHGQASIVSQLPPSRWWEGATLQGEVAANDLLDVTSGRADVQPGRTHIAASVQVVFTPSYYQVLPGLDLNLPLGFEYTPIGRSSIDASQNAGAGDISIGVSATYRTVWQADLQATRFVGGAGAQKLADRSFVTVSVTRSF